MNVFVLTTGRTGSLSFERACAHISNYTSAHESRCHELGESRLNFPDNHIEIDNRLAWYPGLLNQKFGKAAFYVHLSRDKTRTADSYYRRWNRETSIVRAYAYGILKMQEHEIKNPKKICEDYVENINRNITSFLHDKPNKIEISLEDIENGFTNFWSAIKAEGNLQHALHEFSLQHNSAAENKKQDQIVEKTLRIIKKLPYFLKNA